MSVRARVGDTAENVSDSSERPEPGISYAIARLQQRILAGVTERVAPYGLTTLQFTTLSMTFAEMVKAAVRNLDGGFPPG